LDLYAFWYCRALAWRSAPMVLRMLPMLVLAAVVMRLLGLGAWALQPPPSAAAAVLWLLTMAGALCVSCAVTTLMSISLLWTVSGEGIAVLVGSAASLLSGMVIPLPLFPAWAQPILRALPFAAMMDLPARVYTGDIPAAAAGFVLLHQALWAAALIALGRWTLHRISRRIVVQGG
jgi:ABC-2 type transport system permease protein